MLLVTQALSKRVQTSDGELTILDGVSLKLPPRSVWRSSALQGRAINPAQFARRADEPTDGSVIYHGRDNLSNMSEAERAAFRAEWIGFVFQSFQLLSSLTAIENVMLPLELNGEGKASKRRENGLIE